MRPLIARNVHCCCRRRTRGAELHQPPCTISRRRPRPTAIHASLEAVVVVCRGVTACSPLLLRARNTQQQANASALLQPTQVRDDWETHRVHQCARALRGKRRGWGDRLYFLGGTRRRRAVPSVQPGPRCMPPSPPSPCIIWRRPSLLPPAGRPPPPLLAAGQLPPPQPPSASSLCPPTAAIRRPNQRPRPLQGIKRE